MPKRNSKNIYYIYANIKFTIKKRDGFWHLDFYHNNKRNRLSTELKATQENLKVIKNQVIPDLVSSFCQNNKIVEVEEKEWTLDQFAEVFFDLKKVEIREHVLQKNIMHYNKHISQYFGYKILDSITPLELEKWQSELLQKYRPLTVQKFRSILYSIFDKAYKNQIIEKNPLEFVPAPKNLNLQVTEDINPFSKIEIQKILENSNGYMKNFIKLMYASGMRPGEIVALKWEDIDFDRKLIRVHKTRLRSTKGQIKDGDVKTLSSKREVDILPLAQEALFDQMKTTQSDKTGYVFLNSSNQPFYSHDVIAVNFKKILKKAGISQRALYQLRHTFASHMISKGADIVWVSKMLGHKDVSITLKIYTKFIKEDDKVRLQRIEKFGKLLKLDDN